MAIEYLKALKAQKSAMKPILIERKNVYYNEDRIVDDFASATAIRNMLIRKEYKNLAKVIPRSTYQILGNEMNKSHIVLSIQEYEKEILYILRKMSAQEIANLPDVSEGLENTIKSAANNSSTLKEFMSLIKTKRYTQTRIQRILLYALLGIDKKAMEASKKIVPYARVLGFTQKGKQLISQIMEMNPKINMVTSVKRYMSENTNNNKKDLIKMLELDMFATDVYTLAYKEDSKTGLDYTNNMIITN